MLVHMCDKKGCNNRAYDQVVIPINWIDKTTLERVELLNHTCSVIDLCADHANECMSFFQKFLNNKE